MGLIYKMQNKVNIELIYGYCCNCLIHILLSGLLRMGWCFCCKLFKSKKNSDVESLDDINNNTPALDKELFEESVPALSPYFDDTENEIHRMLQYLKDDDGDDKRRQYPHHSSSATTRSKRKSRSSRSGSTDEEIGKFRKSMRGNTATRFISSIKESITSRISKPSHSNNTADDKETPQGEQKAQADDFKFLSLLEDGLTANLQSCRHLTQIRNHGVDDNDNVQQQQGHEPVPPPHVANKICDPK